MGHLGFGEKSDKELYDKATGFVILCLVDQNSNSVQIMGSPSSNFLKNNGHFGEPKLKKHVEKKFAIYYDSIKNLEERNLWALK